MIEQSLQLAVWVFLRLQELEVRYELITPPPRDIALRIAVPPQILATVRDDPYPGWRPPGNFPKGKRRWS